MTERPTDAAAPSFSYGGLIVKGSIYAQNVASRDVNVYENNLNVFVSEDGNLHALDLAKSVANAVCRAKSVSSDDLAIKAFESIFDQIVHRERRTKDLNQSVQAAFAVLLRHLDLRGNQTRRDLLTSNGFRWTLDRTHHELKELVNESLNSDETFTLFLALSHLSTVRFDLEGAKRFADAAISLKADDIPALQRSGELSLAVADFEGAKLRFERIYQLSSRQGGIIAAEALIDMATAHYELSEYEFAGFYLKQCQEAFTIGKFNDHRLRVILLSNIGANICASFQNDQIDLAMQGVDALKRSIELAELYDSELGRAYARNNLGELYRKMGDTELSKVSFEKATNELNRLFGDEAPLHPLMARVLSNLGCLHAIELNAPEEGVGLFEQAISIYERLNLTDECVDIASVHHNLAQALLKMDRDLEGCKAMEKAVRIARRLLPPNSPDLAKMENDLEEVCLLTGRMQIRNTLELRRLS